MHERVLLVEQKVNKSLFIKLLILKISLKNY